MAHFIENFENLKKYMETFSEGLRIQFAGSTRLFSDRIAEVYFIFMTKH